MYVSYKASEALGLELMTALETLCKARHLGNFELNFELVKRLSKEGARTPRWDEDFIQRELSKTSPKEIKKVLVCGPPTMNETFDRALQNRVIADN